MNGNKTVTMKDIALATGFSVNTVARALKDRDDVAPESKKKICQVAKEMHYIHNSAATFLRTGHSGTVAVIIADITNPTFSVGVLEIEKLAAAEGYALLIFNTNENEEAERIAIQTAISKNADGILICPSVNSRDNLEFLSRTGIPFILLGRKADESYRWVVRDDRKCGRLVAEHLIRTGRRQRILLINGYTGISSADERQAGFYEVLKQNHMDADPDLNCVTNVTPGSIGKIIRHLQKKKIAFDGIFAFSDILAMEAMNEVIRSGIRVPEEVSVVGIDNLCQSLPYLPAVDSVGELGESLHTVAFRKLVGILRNTDDTPAHIMLDVGVYARGSVKPL